MTEQKKAKVRYDKWFLIVLMILLFTLATNLVDLSRSLYYDWGNFNRWVRTIACLVAVFGNVWVIKLYLNSTRQKARRIEKLDAVLKDQPEIKAQIIEILKEE